MRDGVNWYAYCGNDPVNRTDPTGLWSAINQAGEQISGEGNVPDFSKPGSWDEAKKQIQMQNEENERVRKINMEIQKQIWNYYGAKFTSPAAWLELYSSALWGLGLSCALGPVGFLIGFSTPIINTTISLGLINYAGGIASLSDNFTVNIELPPLARFGAYAFTMGSTILGDRAAFSGFLPHERGHVAQSLVFGPCYWLVFALPSLVHAAVNGSDSNWYPEKIANYLAF